MHPALKRAVKHWLNKRKIVFPDYQSFLKIKEKARKIRQKNLKNLFSLLKKFKENVEKNGGKVFIIEEKQQIYNILKEILKNKKIILKTKSLTTEEIDLNSFLEKEGKEVIETDLGEFIIQISSSRPSHPTAPAIHLTKEKIAKILSKKFNKNINPDPKEITKYVKSFLKEKFRKFDVGITGANFLISENGQGVLMTNEGNGRMILTFAPMHIIIAGIEKLVENMEEAIFLSQVVSKNATGQKLTSYVSFFKPDPKRIYLILTYGRKAALKHDILKELLLCLRCGACLMVCPVYLEITGITMGSGAYMGGIGAGWAFFTQGKNKAKFVKLCSACYRCKEVCPVDINIPKITSYLKSLYSKNFIKKILFKSSFYEI